VFLGLDLPDCTVDPSSTSNPMDLLWEAYSRMGSGDIEFGRCLYFAARDCFKTVLSSVIELLAVLHLKRDVAHMASVESQSLVCQRYIKRYTNNPFLKSFVTKASERRVEFTHYSDGAVSISPGEWEEMADEAKSRFVATTNFIQIVIATMQGANSLHTQLLVLDELDLAPPEPVEEAKMIPTQSKSGQPPVTLLTSSRKFAFGLVQKELDQADESGLHVRHWNLIDVTQPCPTSRHSPAEPKVKVFTNHNTLRAISESDYASLDEDQRSRFEMSEGYAGCLRNCRIYPACQGRLAVGQKSKSPLLKNIAHVQTLFRSVSTDIAKAQLLCRKPSGAGLIYPNFDRSKHMLSASDMVGAVTGNMPTVGIGKKDLISVMLGLGLECYSGLDHGSTHAYTVVTGFRMGAKFFVVDVISAAELELSQKIEVTQARFSVLGIKPSIFPDTEDPAANKTLRKHFRIREWSKKPGSVVGGIESVRMKLMPPMSEQPDMYFLKDDDGCELLAKDMLSYHWKIDSAGRPTDIPDDKDDDRLDGLRYVVMNVFSRAAGVVLTPDVPTPKLSDSLPTPNQMMANKIHELTGGEAGSTLGMPAMQVVDIAGDSRKRLKTKGFFADFG
jgi:hypothetical protein